jgi:hypothetical protein
MPSSLLSEGRRTLGAAIADARLFGSRGSAEGHKVVRVISWLRLDLGLRLDLVEDPFDSMLGLPNRRLVLLSERASSELALRFSIISPPPAIITGLIRFRRNGS